jgi:hypothetical protein
LAGSGSLDSAVAPGVPPIISEKATNPSDSASFVCLRMIVRPLGKRGATSLALRPAQRKATKRFS